MWRSHTAETPLPSPSPLFFGGLAGSDAQLAEVATTSRWTQEEARDWWQMHAPELVAAPKSFSDP
jgi:hypothetical protein